MHSFCSELDKFLKNGLFSPLLNFHHYPIYHSCQRRAKVLPMFASITTTIKMIVKINGMHRYVYVFEALKPFICSDPEKQVLFKNIEKIS